MTQAEKNKIENAAAEIMNMSTSKIIVRMRYLGSSLCTLDSVPFEGKGIAVDGEKIYYEPLYVVREYVKDSDSITRYIVHMLMHCLFRHMFISPEIDAERWNTACDIAVESLAGELSENFSAGDQMRKMVMYTLKNEVKQLTAERVYAHLLTIDDTQKLDSWRKLFCVDDHKYWYSFSLSGEGEGGLPVNSDDLKRVQGDRAALAKRWESLSEKLQTALETMGRNIGNLSGDFVQKLREVNREKYDYSEFLRKFAVMGEVMRINEDEFDYIFYTHGMNMYGNMPLIEPLEYKEEKRISEFVVAIDTSDSVMGDQVQRFIEKTYNILMQQESFFRKINIRIIQCDTEIHEDVKITSREEMEEYIKNMELKGFGGTDFRPVFDHVNKLIENKEFTNLGGLIYFTDGYGVFPERKPDYNTAFIFVEGMYDVPEVPAWAIKLILDENQL